MMMNPTREHRKQLIPPSRKKVKKGKLKQFDFLREELQKEVRELGINVFSIMTILNNVVNDFESEFV